MLEHVKDTEKEFREMARVLRNGGVMFHYISLGDHYNFDKPFTFLKYSDFIWNNLLTKEGYSYTNRLRVDDYLDLCKENGFEIMDIENIQGRDIDMKKINRRFINKSEEALKTVDCYMLARKAVK
ncbi:MAG: class I SAM-dependent methyltransferase [Spirochaetes bacterium]|nr:class I SAM-dependent methyltransferase [Spirochaetota bacterium]